jgi:hypothetical protein
MPNQIKMKRWWLGLSLAISACGGGSAPPPVPTASLSAQSNVVANGAAATLTWSSTNATSCTASGGWNGTLAAAGTQATSPITAPATYALTCTGAGGTSPILSVVVNVIPTAELTASPPSVANGGASTLTWSSSNSASCSASGDWSGTLAPSGAQSTGALTLPGTYSLSCEGAGGSSAVATAIVNVVPTVTLTASPAVVTSGGASLLTWSSTNATTCTASGGWSGTISQSGTQSTGPLTAPGAYILICTGPGGSSAAAIAGVNVVPTVSLVASPSAISSGAASTLTWNSTNATACAASGGWVGALPSSGTQSSGALTLPAAYSLTCTGAGGTSITATALVNIIPLATLTVYPTVVPSGGSSTLTWSSSNATSCAASGGWSGTQSSSGTQGTGTLTATTTYSLSCAGAGGSSNVSTATATIANGVVTVSPTVAAITLSQSQQFAATVPGGGAATWSVDGIDGGNTTVGTIGASGLYVPGTAVGTHAIVATSVANSSESGSAVVAVTDLTGIFTYHNDLARDGANTHEFALTPINVNTGGFGKLFSCTTDGAIYGQPLWVSGVQINGAQHNIVIVATGHDSLYAFDADASPCVTLWSSNLIDAGHGALSGETPVPSGPTGNLVGVGYGDITPELGVIGTAVIDAGSNTLYVVSKSVNAAQTTFNQRLHAIDLTNGNEKPGSPALIGGTFPGSGSTVTFSARQQNQRSGLVLLNGVVYIAWSAHEDGLPYYGWVMSYVYNGSSFVQGNVLNVTPNKQSGGIWMGGGAMAVDSNNNLYALTGNGTFDATSGTTPNNDFGDSLLQMSPSLSITQYFTPSNQSTDNQGDRDFGSGGAAVLADLPAGSPVTHLLMGGGKDGSLYVFNRDHLGGFGDTNAVQLLPLGHSIFSTGAFWSNNFYIAGAGGALSAFSLDTATAQFALASLSTKLYKFPGGTPSVSAAGAQAGIVWILDNNLYCTKQSSGCGAAVLHAYDAANLANELWNSAMIPSDAAGNAVKFTVPTIANGKVYVGTRGNNIGGVNGSTSVAGELDVYGLLAH